MKTAPFKGKCTLTEHSSLRKRMRAANRGKLIPIQPNEKALLRHPWYRKKKAWDALRNLLGQREAA